MIIAIQVIFDTIFGFSTAHLFVSLTAASALVPILRFVGGEFTLPSKAAQTKMFAISLSLFVIIMLGFAFLAKHVTTSYII